MLITVNCLLFKKKKHEPHECVKLMVVQVGDWMERERRVGSLGFGGLGLGGVCVCARARWRDVRSFMAAVFAVVAIFVS